MSNHSSSERAHDSWGEVSLNYEERVFALLPFENVRRLILQAVRPRRVLDMGCGPLPHLLNDLCRADPMLEVFATDGSRQMLAVAQRNFPRGEVHFTHADHAALPFGDESFDSVISVNSIVPEERVEIDRAVGEVARVLKPGGKFIACMPAFETSLMARDEWKMQIRIDEENHREFDTTGCQCFSTKADLEELLSRHPFSQYDIRPVTFDADEHIDAIRRIYGQSLLPALLRKFPLFEHFLVAHKTV